MFAVGTILVGKYRVDQIIGEGGMGVVVAATHVQLNQRVAVKFLLPSIAHHEALTERFLREARASARLRSEHVCRVIDVGSLEDSSPYIVMEFLEGQDLGTLIKGNGPMPVQTACDYMLQACLGVAEAHSIGIVHRDLKPANLFLTRRPEGTPLIKVLDFGIAKAQGDTNFSLTQTTAVLGSPGYMSPEQLRSSRDVDARSDIWAFGVVLYELITGNRPFTGETITELAVRVAMDPTPSLTGFPPGLDVIIHHCLEKDPAHRYQDLASLAYALAEFGGLAARETAAGVSRVLRVAPTRPNTPIVGVSIPTTMGSAASAIMTAPGGKTRRFGVVLGGLAIVAIAAIAVVLATRGSEPKPAAATPAIQAAVPADAVMPASTTPDASVAPDAARVDAAPTDAPVDAPSDAHVKRPVRPSHPISHGPKEDFGESRH